MTKLQSNSVPPPPPGFVLDDAHQSAADVPAPPPGFELVQDVHNAPEYIPPGVEGYDPATGEVHEPISGGRSFGLGVGDMLTSSFGDELAAGPAMLLDMLPGGRGRSYQQIVGEMRGDQQEAAVQHPYAHLAGEVVGGVSGGVGLAKSGASLAANAARAGKGWFARLIGAGADGGMAAAAYGAGSGENARERVVGAASNVPLGIGFGLGGEALFSGIGALARQAFRGASDIAPGTSATANVEAAGEFGIPLSRAQATRSVSQSNIENQLRSQGAMSAFDQGQNEAVANSIGNVQTRLSGANQNIPGASAAYDTVPGRLRGIRQDLKSASQDAYAASVDNPNVLVSGEAVKELPDFIRNRLSSDQIIIDPMYHTGAARAMKFIDDYLGRLPSVAKPGDSATPMLSGPAGEMKSVDAQLRWIENLRASFRKNFPPIGQDAPALRAIRSALDDWTDSVFDRGLVTADDETLHALKDARAKWSQYMAMAEPKAKIGGKLNPQYEASRVLRYIADKDLSLEEIGNYLWGSSVAAPKTTSFMTAQLLKKTLGTDSPEWNAIRQSFWLRATRAGDEALSPARIAKNLDGLLLGQGKGVAQTLYTPAEMDMMRKYATVMRTLSLPKAGLNNSNTANRLMPVLQRYATNIMGLLGSGAGFLGGLGPMESLGAGTAVALGSRGLQAAAQASRVHAATHVPVPPVPTGYGSAVLRSAPMPMLTDHRPRQPLEITVGVGRK